MRIRKLDQPLNDLADGYCNGFPYTTSISSVQGVSIHFWAGAKHATDEALEAALEKARRVYDIVFATWSYGFPVKFWAHKDIA